ncbi:exopolysaccharide transport protein family protein [Caballeronia glebae]|uniref:Exopolysaccharide transport protein family protein n=1 Tax=Caballeronia glebae TaxID=1777143 RepID=A0A158B7X2_9BURK|nr:GNVR domain-containing protein [Caballeronia glebae]SAK65856.1 exopolysaccharide transport protein family protein [Caballeronia glebae]
MTKDFADDVALPRGEIADTVTESYIRFLKRNYKVIVATTVIFGSVASEYAILATPIYQTSMLLQVQEPPESAGRSSLEDVSSLFAVKPRAATEIQKITSRSVLEAAIAPMHLDISLVPRRDIWTRAQSKLSAAWRRIGGDTEASGVQRGSASVAELPESLRKKRLQVVSEGSGHYRLVTPDGETFKGAISTLETFRTKYGAISLKIDALPGDAGQVFDLRRLSRSAVVDNLQGRLSVTERGKESNIVSASLEGTDPVFIRNLLHAIGTTYVSGEEARRSADAQKSMEALSTELPILKGQIEKSEDRFSRFKNETGSVNLSEQANVVIRQLADVQAKMTDLKVQRQELLRRFTKDDSTVLAVDRQITTLSARATQLEAEARMLPELEQQALRLSRDISVNNQLYAGLLSNMQQLRFIKAGRVNEVRLIDDATLPEEPIKPRRWLIVALGILGGAFLGILLALAKKAWSGKIDGPDDIERRTGLPVFVSGAFGDVSRAASYRQGIDGVHARESSQCPDSRLPSGESLRRFSAIFEHKMHESGARIALFSGVNAWTGTSFVAEQVAAQLAQNGARVLLIDADARAGRLSKRRNAGAAPGLSDVISGRSTFEEVVRHGSAGDFDLLPSGVQKDGVPASLSRDTLGRSLTSVGDRYQFVILDAAPVLSAAETLVMARQAGCVFVVARSNLTRLADLTACVDAFESIGVRVTGAVLNTLGRRRRYRSAAVPVHGVEASPTASNTRGSSSAFGGTSLTTQREAIRDGMTPRPSGLHET